MATTRNKLIPLLALAAIGITGTVLWRQFSADAPVKPGAALQAPPQPGGQAAAGQRSPGGRAGPGAQDAGRPADGDTTAETLSTVVASNAELRRQVQAALEQHERVRAERDEMRGNQENIAARAREQVLAQLRAEGVIAAPVAMAAPPASDTRASEAGLAAAGPLPAASRPAGRSDRPPGLAALDSAGQAFGNAVDSAGVLFGGLHQPSGSSAQAQAPSRGTPAGRDAARRQPVRPQGIPAGLGFDDAAMQGDGLAAGDPGATLGPYQVIAPLGYEEVKDKRAGSAGRPQLVRAAVGTAHGGGGAPGPGIRPAALQQDTALAAALAAAGPAAAAEPVDTPYFTVPENATLTRVTAMTAIIGRVPVDGRVTDPMQFKAIVGRENLAANGWDVPDDISGIVVSGVAVGDMALSCSEGRIHSLTFVFEDGSIRTVSSRRRGGGAAAQGIGAAGAGSQQPALGYISDLWGNPCISGRFVTNAPAYLTDVVGLRSLAVASRAYAAAQTTTTESAQTGTTSTAVTGSRGAYVLGQAASGATDEVTNWILARLKNSFDAVVTPAGQKVVLHIEQEIAIDKPARPRRLDHHPGGRTATHNGAHHGME